MMPCTALAQEMVPRLRIDLVPLDPGSVPECTGTEEQCELLVEAIHHYASIPGLLVRYGDQLDTWHAQRLEAARQAATARAAAAVGPGMPTWQVVLWVAGGVVIGVLFGFIAGAIATS